VHVLLIPSWYATSDNPVLGSFFREQAHALVRAGHKVGLIAPHLRSVRELPAGLAGATKGILVNDDEGVATYRLEGAQLLPGLNPANDRAWVSAGRKLFARYVADHGQPDILHAHATFMAGIIGAEISGESGVPLVITEHSTVYERRPIPEFQLEEAREALASAGARLVVSPQLGESMERILGDAAGPYEWVPNVVDSMFLEADLPAERPDGPFRFLNVAFLHEKKGHADLLTAFAEQFAGDPDVQLRIGGDGPERERLREKARALGITDQVAWLGSLGRSAVREEMLAADAFVLSSRLETFGVVVIEALACGLPVIATRSGGPECIVTDADGVLVPVGDVGALGAALARIKNGTANYDAQAIRDDCAARFGEAALLSKLEGIYARVMEAGGAS
jgi:glycosyltransferase involved in cell wall biosynthesis